MHKRYKKGIFRSWNEIKIRLGPEVGYFSGAEFMKKKRIKKIKKKKILKSHINLTFSNHPIYPPKLSSYYKREVLCLCVNKGIMFLGCQPAHPIFGNTMSQECLDGISSNLEELSNWSQGRTDKIFVVIGLALKSKVTINMANWHPIFKNTISQKHLEGRSSNLPQTSAWTQTGWSDSDLVFTGPRSKVKGNVARWCPLIVNGISHHNCDGPAQAGMSAETIPVPGGIQLQGSSCSFKWPPYFNDPIWLLVGWVLTCHDTSQILEVKNLT